MEKMRPWATEIWAGIVSCFCWFTPEHCEQVSHVLGMIANLFGVSVAGLTLVFITMPKVMHSKLFKQLSTPKQPNNKNSKGCR